MRFRYLWSTPTFGAYLEGHSFWRTCAYGLASDMGRGITRPAEVRARTAAVEQDLGIKMNLMKAGILPYPGERKAATAPRRAAYVERVKHSVAIPAVPTICAAPLEKEWCPAKAWSGPAAVKPNGGVRGSTATRWRR